MSIKLFSKLGILMLAVIFLMSMVSYSIPQGKGKGKDKPDKPGKPGGGDAPEIYKVTISINGDSPGFETGTCGFDNYFYAVGKKGKYLLDLESDGILTPGPTGEPAVPLTMWVNTGIGDITLEGCTFYDESCHGNLPGRNTQFPDEFNNEYQPEMEGIYIRFLKSQDSYGPQEDIRIRWHLDMVPGPKKHGVGWHLHSRYGEYGLDTVISTTLFPSEGLEVGEWWWTDVEGTFRLLHDGIGLGDDYDPANNDILLEGFSIHLIIERVQ